MDEKKDTPGTRPGQPKGAHSEIVSAVLRRWTAAVRAAALVQSRLESPWLDRQRTEDPE